MLSLVPGPPEDAARSLFGLLCTGLVDYKVCRPAVDAARSAGPIPPGSGIGVHDRAAARDRAVLARATLHPEPTGEDLRQMVLSAYESLRYKDHFEFLDVPRARQ